MFDNTCNQMNNWRWNNPHAFGDEVDRSNQQTTNLGKVKPTGELFPWYGSDVLMAKIEPPSCRQYKPGEFLTLKPLNWDEIFDKDDDDDENRVDQGVPRGGSSHADDGNENDNSESVEDMQGGENGTRKGKGTKEGERESDCGREGDREVEGEQTW
jgi:hypothetical protein